MISLSNYEIQKNDAASRKIDRMAFEQWKEAKNEEEVEKTATITSDLGETLSKFLLYLADGYKIGRRHSKSILEQRAWVILYSLRPDLIDGESAAMACLRWGAAKGTFYNNHIAVFRRLFPGCSVSCKVTRLSRAKESEIRKQRERLRIKARRKAVRRYTELARINAAKVKAYAIKRNKKIPSIAAIINGETLKKR